MGSPLSEPERGGDETRHRVTLTRGSWLAACLVTQGQWRAVTGDNPSQFQGQDDLPVETVSWDDCVAFCGRLGEKTGRRFRLPTEAEWEYACRAGTTTPFSFGRTVTDGQANYDGRSAYGQPDSSDWYPIEGLFRRRTTPAGSFPPNAWGLYDLHGNVGEWCRDLYGYLSVEDQEDPQGVHLGEARVVRGGGWFDRPNRCRSAYRYAAEPGRRSHDTGCRVLLCPD
jgi:formylglycine-generating enzyme required for sulfatase activity